MDCWYWVNFSGTLDLCLAYGLLHTPPIQGDPARGRSRVLGLVLIQKEGIVQGHCTDSAEQPSRLLLVYFHSLENFAVFSH